MIKRWRTQGATKNERRRFLTRPGLIFLALIVLAMGSIALAGEKIENLTYTYPQGQRQDPYPAQQDPEHTKLIDGRIGIGGGGAVWGTWEGIPQIVVLFDLQKNHVVDQIKIWSTEDMAYHHIGSFEIHVSLDGENFHEALTVTNPNPKLEKAPPQRLSYPFGQYNLALEARYIKLVVKRDSTPGVRTQILEEVEIWGQPIPLLKTIVTSKGSFSPEKEQLAISYEAAGDVSLDAEVFSHKGERVTVLAKGKQIQGADTIYWDGKDEANNYVADGSYKIQLTAKDNNQLCVRTTSVEVVSQTLQTPILLTLIPTQVNRAEITLTAKSTPGMELKLKLNEEDAGRAQVDARGLAIFKVLNLEEGANQVTAATVDPAGNESQYALFPEIIYNPQEKIGQVVAEPSEFAPGLSQTQISFCLAQATTLGLRLKTEQGNFVRELIPLSSREAGLLQFAWDGKDEAEQIVAGGTYLVEVYSESSSLARCKVVVNNQLPGKPYLILPEPGSTKSEGFLDFVWEGRGEASRYLLSLWPRDRLEDKQTITCYQPNYRFQLSADLVVGQWEWQVVAINGAGTTGTSGVGSFTIDWRVPGALEVCNLQLGPNPFAPTSSSFNKLYLGYTLTQGARVEVAIYNLAGKLVYSFGTEFQGMGDHRLLWDGRDASGRLVNKGAYILFFKATNEETRGQATFKRVISVIY